MITPTDKQVEAPMKIEVCSGTVGLALYVNDERVAGPRHNGIMETVLSATIKPPSDAHKAVRLTRALAALRDLQEAAAIALETLPEDQHANLTGEFLASIHRVAVRGQLASDEVTNAAGNSAALTAAFSLAAPAGTVSFWVLEMIEEPRAPAPRYWAGNGIGWAYDISTAIHFERKEDVDAFQIGDWLRGNAVEHAMIYRPSALPPPQPQPSAGDKL